GAAPPMITTAEKPKMRPIRGVHVFQGEEVMAEIGTLEPQQKCTNQRKKTTGSNRKTAAARTKTYKTRPRSKKTKT
ncbi:hypothetical protein, partial [Klebsiella pneumoniae]|uniref:hypothetical protein n=1 Tax=Klebsiella pneumoniae TaxID=573 RepID=UPI003B5B25BB